MTNAQTLERLESRLTQLIDGMLARKGKQVGFLIGLNQLDDILVRHQRGMPITKDLALFIAEYRDIFIKSGLSVGQKKRLGEILSIFYRDLIGNSDADSDKLSDEIKDWLKDLGDRSFSIILKGPEEKASLSDRFYALLHRENRELNILLERNDHLLTCLDDLLKSADAKQDYMFEHMAATLIYFLQMEGYKVDPYVKKLRIIRNNRKLKKV
ncbi:MAG: hypothetical protein KAR42_04915 [candidate division Zixibacteria bacterium]|nr:hypothetical protein [candidate division Zixibacteria bacterium]